ncbi:MAG TPA: transposase [Ktedonobacteraceae bacterium]|nr:transposase [Ktedonobacteraceae bacterium]
MSAAVFTDGSQARRPAPRCWLAAVAEGRIEELQRFANGLKQDKAAVLMGLTRSSNNAQAEGQVTRIKLMKRMMYGRAGFPLLRQRVLHRF